MSYKVLRLLQVDYLEGTLASKEATISQMQQSHDEMLRKIAHVTEGQAVSWQQQKTDIEEQYSHLVAELHTRQKVCRQHLLNLRRIPVTACLSEA